MPLIKKTKKYIYKYITKSNSILLRRNRPGAVDRWRGSVGGVGEREREREREKLNQNKKGGGSSWGSFLCWAI